MKDPKFGRKGHMIEDVETGKMEQFKSVNTAKRESRARQMAHDGALGRGSVRLHGDD